MSLFDIILMVIGISGLVSLWVFSLLENDDIQDDFKFKIKIK